MKWYQILIEAFNKDENFKIKKKIEFIVHLAIHKLFWGRLHIHVILHILLLMELKMMIPI